MIFQENELVTFIVVFGILVFVFANRKRINHAADQYLLISFLFYAIASVLTVVEAFALPVLCNYLEHTCVLLHSIFFTLWIWRIVKPQQEAGK